MHTLFEIQNNIVVYEWVNQFIGCASLTRSTRAHEPMEYFKHTYWLQWFHCRGDECHQFSPQLMYHLSLIYPLLQTKNQKEKGKTRLPHVVAASHKIIIIVGLTERKQDNRKKD